MNCVLFCNKLLGGRALHDYPLFRDVFKIFVDVICRFLDAILCNIVFFFRIRYVINRRKCMCYSEGSWRSFVEQ